MNKMWGVVTLGKIRCSKLGLIWHILKGRPLIYRFTFPSWMKLKLMMANNEGINDKAIITQCKFYSGIEIGEDR
jgi:hypothetical protein